MIINIPKNFGFFHFVGIGGIGMSGIAEILIKSGYQVQGSDVSSSKIIDRLISLGIKIHIGHDKINVKNKKQLGSDRIANAIGAKKFKNCLVLDFGTATTFDVIKNSVYEGGVIAPGVKLSIKNLSQSTALLPLINLSPNQKKIGKNTKEALNAGFVWGYEGLINNIVDKIISKNKKKFKIILTGGYANFFKKGPK